MEITFKANAYKFSFDTLKEIESGETMPFISHHATNETLIGTAVVKVTLFTKDKIHAAELDVLNKKLEATRAENQQRENAILDQISKLQALTYVEPA